MAVNQLSPEVLRFLTRLSENNTRVWFEDHKAEFRTVEGLVKRFYNALAEQMRGHDEIDKLKFFRIYRDVRFSKDKTPYKTHFAGSFSRSGMHRRGGYYLQIKPGASFLAGGFWEPERQDLLRIREELARDAGPLRKIMSEETFKTSWGQLVGEELKTAPQGFDRDHTNIDLLRKKQFIFVRNYTDAKVCSPDFLEEANRTFSAIRPYFDLMSEILTTNSNGESLLDHEGRLK